MTSPAQTVEDLYRLFGGGPIAAAFAVLLVAIVVLFFMYARAKSEHLKTAMLVMPVAEKMTATLEHSTKTMEESIRALQVATEIIKAKGQGRARGPGSGQDGGGKGGPSGPTRAGA